MAETFHTFFLNIVNHLRIAFEDNLLGKSVAINGPLVKITEFQKTHISVGLIKEHCNKFDKKFSFEKICYKAIQ